MPLWLFNLSSVAITLPFLFFFPFFFFCFLFLFLFIYLIYIYIYILLIYTSKMVYWYRLARKYIILLAIYLLLVIIYIYFLIENTQTSLIIKSRRYIMENSLFKKIGTLSSIQIEKSKMPKVCLANWWAGILPFLRHEKIKHFGTHKKQLAPQKSK